MNRKTAKTQTEPENGTGSNRKVLPLNQRSGSLGQVPAVQQSTALHPGLHSDPLDWVMQLNSGLAPRIQLQGVCSAVVESKSMKIQPTKKQTNSEPITPEGEYQATVKSVADKVGDGPNGQPEVVVEYVLVGVSEPIKRTYPAKIGGRSPLWRDAKAILRRTWLNSDENETGFDPVVLKDQPCRVVVAHRADGSGKLTAQAKLVLAPKAATSAVAATVA